jgi:hypothetical protein
VLDLLTNRTGHLSAAFHCFKVVWFQQGRLALSFVVRFNFQHPDAIRMSSSDFAQELLTGDT